MSELEESGLYPHKHDNVARVYEDDKGMLWVTHNELLECGYRGISDFDIVWINETFYELQGYNPGADAWWVEEVVNGEAPETPPES